MVRFEEVKVATLRVCYGWDRLTEFFLSIFDPHLEINGTESQDLKDTLMEVGPKDGGGCYLDYHTGEIGFGTKTTKDVIFDILRRYDVSEENVKKLEIIAIENAKKKKKPKSKSEFLGPEQRNPGSPNPHSLLIKSEADKLFNNSEYFKAEKAYAEAKWIEVSSPQNDRKLLSVISSNLSLCCLKQNRPSDALDHAKESIFYDDSWIRGYFRQSAALLELNRTKEALMALYSAPFPSLQDDLEDLASLVSKISDKSVLNSKEKEQTNNLKAISLAKSIRPSWSSKSFKTNLSEAITDPSSVYISAIFESQILESGDHKPVRMILTDRYRLLTPLWMNLSKQEFEILKLQNFKSKSLVAVADFEHKRPAPASPDEIWVNTLDKIIFFNLE